MHILHSRLGSQLLPVRCYYCNRFLSRYQPLIQSNTDIDFDTEELKYCCRGLIGVTQQTFKE